MTLQSIMHIFLRYFRACDQSEPGAQYVAGQWYAPHAGHGSMELFLEEFLAEANTEIANAESDGPFY